VSSISIHFGLVRFYLTLLLTSASFTTPKSDCLSVFLKLRDKLIALLDNIVVLLVFIVWSVGFNNSLDTVNRTRDSLCSDKIGKITALR
jgi:hypothetical protein